MIWSFLLLRGIERNLKTYKFEEDVKADIFLLYSERRVPVMGDNNNKLKCRNRKNEGLWALEPYGSERRRGRQLKQAIPASSTLPLSFCYETDKMLIEASESPILYASLSLCQTLFTLSDGRSHSEGWWIDLNTRQRVVCVAERHRLRQTGRAEGRHNETESWTDMQSCSSCTWLTCKSLHILSSQWQINTDADIRRHVSLWYHLLGP